MSQKVQRRDVDDGSIEAWGLIDEHAGPMTSEQLRELADIPETFVEKDFTVNKWDALRKDDEGIVTLWQAKGKYAPPKDYVRGLESLVERIEKAKGALPRIRYTEAKLDGEVLLEIAPVDMHLGLYAWADHTGTAYDLDRASELYLGAIRELLRRAEPFRPSRILLLFGNDFLHVDNVFHTTTKGTPQQDSSGTFYQMVERGIEAVLQGVELCREVAPVDVLCIPGNHDHTVTHLLGRVIDAWYRRHKYVTVDHRPNATKYYRWGVNLIGYIHGKLNAQNFKDLPLLMASDAKQDWAETKFREWHLGHEHRSSNKEQKGVRVRHLPSLVAPNIWHDDMTYRNQWRACEAYLWERERGYAAHLSVNIDPDTGELL